MKHRKVQDFDPSSVLKDLDAAAEGIHRAKVTLKSLCDGTPAVPMESSASEEGVAVRAYLRSRRLREHLLPGELFGEPAWDILLDLYASETEGRKVSISSACVASAVPATTALRWLNALNEFGLVGRVPDASDARRFNLELTLLARSHLRTWIKAALLGGEQRNTE